MLNFFRINDPYRLVVVFGFLLIIRVIMGIVGLPFSTTELRWLLLGERLGDGFLMYREAFDFVGPFSAGVYDIMDHIAGRSRIAHHIISTLLIMLQAGVLNFILLRNKAYNENNYVPAFIYVVLASSVLDFMALSPQLMSLTFILLALNNIFRRIDNEVTDELFLSAGIFLGISTLFYLPSVVYFFVFLLALLLFTTAIVRRLLLFFYGLLLPLILTYGYYYWFDAHWDFINSFFVRGLFGDRTTDLTWSSFLLITSPAIFFGIISIYQTFVARGFANFQVKIQQVMLLSLLAGALSLVIDVEFAAIHLILFVPGLSFFISHYMLLLRRRWARVLLPIFMVLSLLLFPHALFNFHDLQLPIIEVKDIEVKDETLMVIGGEPTDYLHHQLKSPFMDPELTAQKLDGLHYYQTANVLFDLFDKSDPDIIEDRLGIMSEVFHRFPTIEQKYEKSGSRFIKIPE
ncbi:MAG: hypothetical protein KI790_08485 [Cyclobacteriaceae bacterium]|nr:hypothetical protein [Cyclobacteriaceae bacterium HetDA_MAG_MS6]